MTAKILYLDYETAPLRGSFWGIRKENIGLKQIDTDFSVLSMAWAWGGGRVHYADTFERDNRRDDRSLQELSWDLLDEADIVVAQNGVRFDMRKIRARLVQSGFPPFSPVRVIDTYLSARKLFGFTSHKQEWMAQILTENPKGSHRKFPGFELWAEYLAGNPAARTEMKKYNMQDIRGLRDVYLKIRPWIDDHPNMAAYYDDNERRCHRCGSTDLDLAESPHFTDTGKYTAYTCNSCGGFSRTRYTENTLAKRKALLK